MHGLPPLDRHSNSTDISNININESYITAIEKTDEEQI
jgi:hypothetical protein